MIQWFLQFFRNKPPEELQKPVADLDLNNVYVRLKMAMNRVNSTGIQFIASSASLGKIHSFSETLPDFLKSLLEVNRTVKENEHILTGQFFYARNIRSIRFDKFLFVQDGFYAQNAGITLQQVLEQIDVYYDLMHEADKAVYGVMEHNHRQLFSYTESLIVFLDALFNHFGE